jgi:hypothetical protein
MTNGRMARFNERARCLFHNFETESTSDALRRTIKHITAATLTSATPIVVNALISDVVPIMDENIDFYPSRILQVLCVAPY